MLVYKELATFLNFNELNDLIKGLDLILLQIYHTILFSRLAASVDRISMLDFRCLLKYSFMFLWFPSQSHLLRKRFLLVLFSRIVSAVNAMSKWLYVKKLYLLEDP